jgi:tripartite-type tricarboxylate transporter receptor subunit TctC
MATLVMGHIGTHAVNPALYKSLPYDAARDFTPVAPVASSPNEMRTRLAAEGVDIMKASPAEFAEYVKNEIAKWAKVIRQAGIRAD